MTNIAKESTEINTPIRQPSTIGLDLAKNIMHLHALDDQGNTLWKKNLKTDELVTFLKKLNPCLIGIEACGGTHYWHRTLSSLGHIVHIMSPMRVKAFVEGQKTTRMTLLLLPMLLSTNKHVLFLPKRSTSRKLAVCTR